MHFFVISVAVVVLDQWAKYFMSSILPLCVYGRCESIEILPFFKLTLLHNQGAAFSFLHDAGGWQRWFLVTVSVVMSVVITAWLYRVYQTQKLVSYALCLILGGAIGNLVDRVMHGYVVDYLVFYYDTWYFPAFNVADTCISIGAGLLILDMLLPYFRPGHNAEERA